MDNEQLLQFALDARKHAKSPTGFYVGVALLTESGKVYTGCNLGSEDGLFNICAERVAFIKMLSEGESKVEKMMVVGGQEDNLTLTTPCGICRQFLLEYAKEATIICANKKQDSFSYHTFTIEDLLPHGYEMQ